MDNTYPNIPARLVRLVIPISTGIGFALLLLVLAHGSSPRVLAAPIDPPAGYPKFTQSRMEVSPTLAYSGGAVLEYTIEIINTGAYTGANTSFSDLIPANTTYNNDATSSVLPSIETRRHWRYHAPWVVRPFCWIAIGRTSSS